MFLGPQWWKDFVHSGGLAFVAEEPKSKTPIGFIGLEIRTGSSAYLAWVHVDEAWRRRRVAQQLLEHALSKLKERGFDGLVSLHVETANVAAKQLYERRGFVASPQIVQDHPYEGHEAYFMELRVQQPDITSRHSDEQPMAKRMKIGREAPATTPPDVPFETK